MKIVVAFLSLISVALFSIEAQTPQRDTGTSKLFLTPIIANLSHNKMPFAGFSLFS